MPTLAHASPIRPARRFHRNQRGNVALFLVFQLTLLYAVTAMVWNTGVVASDKVKLQTAADTAAYSAAVRTARMMNLNTASNLVIMQCFSASGIPWGWIQWLGAVPASWADALSQVCNSIWTVAACIARGIEIGVREVPAWLGIWPDMLSFWASNSLAELGGSGDLATQVKEICKFQDAMWHGTPKAIYEQTEALENFYSGLNIFNRVEIHVAQPGREAIWDPDTEEAKWEPPLRDAEMVDWLGIININTLMQFMVNDFPGRADGSDMNPLIWGRGSQNWRSSLGLPSLFSLILHPIIWHGQANPPGKVLVSSTAGIIETRPELDDAADSLRSQSISSRDTNDRDRYYTFVAVASRSGKAGVPLLDPGGRFMASGIFDKGATHEDKIVAVAEAEVHNLISDSFMGFLPVPAWRTWSPWGITWSARLTRITAAEHAYDSDEEFKRHFEEAGISGERFKELMTESTWH
ncbi:MAG: pilus assembly protein TadG-related protein [Planctomycetota bacterium]